MLVLSRMVNQSIMIGDDVEVIIVGIRGDRVRLGITAPKHIPVHRREIYDKSLLERRTGQKARKDSVPPTDKPTKSE